MTPPRLTAAGRRTASRVDPLTAVTDIAEFVGLPGAEMAACTHIPPEPADVGLVMCPSLFNEFAKNYRREVLLARGLAACGVAVERLHYRGTGHSDGDHSTITFESMVEDVALATERLRAMTAVKEVVFLGTRFGALVAANAAAATSSPVAVFEPVLDADSYFQEGFRAKMMLNVAKMMLVKAHDPALTTSSELLAELNATGSLDVLGDPVGRDLFQSASGRTFLGELGDERRSVLLVQLGTAGAVRREYTALAEAMESRSCEVSTLRVGSREVWWFFDEREFMDEKTTQPLGMGTSQAMVPVISDWLRRSTNVRAVPT